jgi:molybdenum cofactor cytidylyltransferase
MGRGVKKSAAELVDELVEAIVKQREAVHSGSTKDVRYWARRITPRKIRQMGDDGNRELATLLRHPDWEVRATAAVYLMSYMPEEALAVFRELAERDGLVGWAARMRIKEWEEHPEHYAPGYKYQPPETEHGAVVLAAGEAKRFGAPKLLMPFGRSTVLGSIVRKLSAIDARPIVVVAGANAPEISEALKRTRARVVRNTDLSAGMISSVRVGVEALPESLKRFMIVLGDQPRVRPRDLIDVLAEQVGRPKGIAIPVYKGKRGHPVSFHMRYRSEILALSDQQTLRGLIEAHNDDVLEVEVRSDACVSDIDTREDYERELRRWQDER